MFDIESDYQRDAYMHLSIHRRIKVFDPRLTTNPIILEYLNNSDHKAIIKSRQTSIASLDAKPELSPTYHIIPVSFRSIIQEQNQHWSMLIDRLVFDERLYGIFYSEYSDMLDNVVSIDSASKEYLVYREYKTGLSIFHVAGKLRLMTKSFSNGNSTISQKIRNIETELHYILECYKELGKVFRNGNELTINCLEDLKGVYLRDYMSKFAEDLCNSSLL